MNYKNFDLFPNVVTRYSYDPEKIEIIKQICKEIQEKIFPGNKNFNFNNADSSLRHYYNNSFSSILHEVDELKELREWVESCAKHFMTEVLDYFIEDDNKIITTDSWLNVCGERATQVRHNHHNCIVSGTYYVNRSESVHAGIEFYRPNIEFHPVIVHQSRIIIEGDQSNKYTRNIETLYPSTGDLLLWSSEMLHGYNGFANFLAGRTSISMNFLPKTVNNGQYSFSIEENQK